MTPRKTGKKTAARRKKTRDPLAALTVIDRLEVGPVRLEPARLSVPYRVHRKGKSEQAELRYRFGENVFDPQDADCQNLATMIGAQVALNYGLFCREIAFRGPLDQHDQRFLTEMARNTAREIYVKKFLEPNPFLVGAAAKLPALKRKDYLRARLVFPDAIPTRSPAARTSRAAARPAAWNTNSTRHAILSSGGKDSLLSYGALREIGKEVHPIFINESGRHWFTALNAFRHFQQNVWGTARVWTNSDRVFAWMLRHLPFVRSDFASVRADEYPIRLWTVAVFLFGALPLLKKRGIGRLIIGDEYDTTERTSFQGITHYNGLFDQSRYFDNALSRYFQRKGWQVSQFSVLRSLSELLILKVLAMRYPELQRHQVSCHATHIDGERVLPCGRCEKCRRIIGMLVALGADPHNCGYTSEQISHSLAALARKGVHQEKEGAQHLAFLLREKGMLSDGRLGALAARARPEIMKLRIQKDRSPLDAIPGDIREPLMRLFLVHAEGVVRRSGRFWIDHDLFSDPEFSAPYPFDKPSGGDAGADEPMQRDGSDHAFTHILGELSWPEAEKRFKEVDLAILPVGAVEQHGPHLPLDTDAYDADYLAKEVARRCGEPRPLVLPLIPYGVSYHHDDFSGTLSISPDTLSRLTYEIGMCVARNGVAKLVIINGHGGNGPALHFAAQMINRDAHIFTCVDTGESSDFDIEAMTSTPNDVHAGEVETSTALATRPELVDMKAASRFVPEFSSRFLDFTSKRSVGWYAYTARISPNGVLGDPTKASAEKGRQMWDVMIARLVEFVEDLKGMTMAEIYQRRY